MATYTLEDFERSDVYHNSFLIPRDEALEFARKNSEESGLPPIAVSTAQGKFLSLLARTIGAKRILEVGTLGGYSTIWLARALPDNGELITLELSPKHAEVAGTNIDHAKLSSKVKIIVGPAAESIVKLQPEPPFDLVFIDADKAGNPHYLHEAKRLIKKGGVIIVDNVVFGGRINDLTQTDVNTLGTRKMLEDIKNDPELDATTVGTAGEKGFDGFTYILRK